MERAKNRDATVEDVKKELKSRGADIEDVFELNGAYDFGRQLGKDFVQRLGNRSLPVATLNGVPLVTNTFTDDEFEELVIQVK